MRVSERKKVSENVCGWFSWKEGRMRVKREVVPPPTLILDVNVTSMVVREMRGNVRVSYHWREDTLLFVAFVLQLHSFAPK